MSFKKSFSFFQFHFAELLECIIIQNLSSGKTYEITISLYLLNNIFTYCTLIWYIWKQCQILICLRFVSVFWFYFWIKIQNKHFSNLWYTKQSKQLISEKWNYYNHSSVQNILVAICLSLWQFKSFNMYIHNNIHSCCLMW